MTPGMRKAIEEVLRQSVSGQARQRSTCAGPTHTCALHEDHDISECSAAQCSHRSLHMGAASHRERNPTGARVLSQPGPKRLTRD